MRARSFFDAKERKGVKRGTQIRAAFRWVPAGITLRPFAHFCVPLRQIILLLLAILLLSACAKRSLEPQDAAPPAPDAASDEAGLLMQMDRFEEDLKVSPDRLRDPKLEAYLNELTCRVAGEHCPQFRVYILRQPFFNAAVGPNGMLLIWSGLLLRVEDEAQLAFAIAHEIGHYQQRHTLERWRKLKSTSNVAMALQVMTAGIGVGLVGAAAGLGANGALFAFNRDQERAADDFGLDRLAALGYDDRRAGALWGAVWDEERVREKELLSSIFASHPPSAERRDRLSAAARSDTGELGKTAFEQAVSHLRQGWLDDEIGRRHYAQTEVLLTRLEGLGFEPGTIAYAQAEMYRRRARTGDLERALRAYQRAVTSDNAPPLAWRGLGLVLRQLKRDEEAQAPLREYLQRAPDAEDRAMIESWLR